MIKQTPGKIFLADQRGLTESSRFWRYSTFSFGAYEHEHKAPFGPLYGLNEETLGGTQQLDFTAAPDSYLLLLPITGNVAVRRPAAATMTVGVEEMLLLSVPAGGNIQFVNPYETELITFLHLWVRAGRAVPAAAQRFAFELPAIHNQLAEVVARPQLPFSVYIGRFEGRREVVHPLADGAAVFAYVLAGAFEVQGRLLHEKDGLALWDTAEVELEALSNNALVVVIELLAYREAAP